MRARRPERAERTITLRIALVLCGALMLAGVTQLLIHDRPDYAEKFGPAWLPLAAGALGAAGASMGFSGGWRRPRAARASSWGGLLLLVWAASGLPIDLLRVVGLLTPGLMPPEIDWPGLVNRTLALAAAVVLARLALARPTAPSSTDAARWYGYAAFALALPYPLVKTWWALGGTFGLLWSGAGGHLSDGDPLHRFELWLPAVPWLLAAALSLLLVSGWRWIPRRVLLVAGWSATAAVAIIGPAAFWTLLAALVAGRDPGFEGIANWVAVVFYGSWFLWAIAGGAATRSYQLRSQGVRRPSTGIRSAPDAVRHEPLGLAGTR